MSERLKNKKILNNNYSYDKKQNKDFLTKRRSPNMKGFLEFKSSFSDHHLVQFVINDPMT